VFLFDKVLLMCKARVINCLILHCFTVRQLSVAFLVMYGQAVDHRPSSSAIFLNIFNGIGVRARGAGGCSPPDSGKTIIFRANGKFFGQKPAAKNEKIVFIK